MTANDPNQQADGDDEQTPADTSQPTTLRVSRTFSFGSQPPPDAGVTIVPGRQRRFEWTWRPSGTNEEDVLQEEPATYYEAITGNRDPRRETFITARRISNGLVWAVTLGLPALVVGIAIATGQSLEAIVIFGVGAAIVGMLFRQSFPKTPFD